MRHDLSRARLLRLARWFGLVAALGALDAHAIPAFARKYGTSCQTCHTVYPKLNPFGELFRRRGYRFPGVDADEAKQEAIPLGQEAQAKQFPQAIWPGTLPPLPPLALGFDGQAALHPDSRAGGAQADNGAAFTLHDLVGSVHLWSGGSFDEKITFLAEVTVDSAKGLEVETARLHFSDLLGPPQALNLVVGQGHANLTSFSPNSSYLADLSLPSVAVAALYGANSPSFALGDNTAGLEANGVLLGRFDYSLGVNAGSNLGVRPTENAYLHLGAKWGGLGFDGSNSGGAADPAHPGEETALTVDVFGYRAASRFGLAGGAQVQDTAWVGGAALRAQMGPIELDSGATFERHARVQPDLAAAGSPAGADLFVQYDELSWLALPWLVPAVRFELYRLAPAGSPSLWDARVLPGVVALVRPNLKLQLLAQLETASGAPPAGWLATGGFAAPAAPRGRVGLEAEAIWVRLATAW